MLAPLAQVLAAIDQDTDPGIGQQILKFPGLPGGDQIKRAQIIAGRIGHQGTIGVACGFGT